MGQQAPTHESSTTRTWILRAAADTDGALHEQRVWYAPGSPFPPRHLHRSQDERFEIEQGAMTFIVGDEARDVVAGESVDIPAGTPHRACDASDTEPAVVRWETRPALRTGELFTAADALESSGTLGQALFAHEYRDVFRVAGALGAVIPLLAVLARLLGRRLPQPR